MPLDKRLIIQELKMKETKTKKKKPSKKGGQVEKTEWEVLQEEMEKAEGGSIQIVDLTSTDTPEDVDLETTYSFSVFYKTPAKHRLYKGAVLYGTFSGHVATFEDHIKMGHVRSQCRGGLPPDSFDEDFNMMVELKASCTILLDTYPDWFNLEQLYDQNVAVEVYSEVMKKEAIFRGDVL
jgi:hypothetical protein